MAETENIERPSWADGCPLCETGWRSSLCDEGCDGYGSCADVGYVWQCQDGCGEVMLGEDLPE